jgi:hypothetical protein
LLAGARDKTGAIRALHCWLTSNEPYSVSV